MEYLKYSGIYIHVLSPTLQMRCSCMTFVMITLMMAEHFSWLYIYCNSVHKPPPKNKLIAAQSNPSQNKTCALWLNKIRKGSRKCQFSKPIESNSQADEVRMKIEAYNRGKTFISFLLPVISNHWGRQERVISERVQQFCPSWDYIIFPNCKWSLSIHQTMNQQCGQGRENSMRCQPRQGVCEASH